MTSTTKARIDHLITTGEFNLDGETHIVENNVWLLGNDDECIVFDAPHDADAIADAIGDRRLLQIVCTHAHDDHVRVAPALADRFGATIALHPADEPVWELSHPDRRWDHDLTDGQTIEVAGITLEVIHTPGHSPGGVCLYSAEMGILISGDTLFNGGPGATGRSFSDRDTIVESVRTRLLCLPGETVVHTGHGDSTTIAAEQANLG